MKGTRACVIRAPAKVNLYLEVGERRPDGFHEIDTLFQAVSLWDEIRVERVPSGVTLAVVGPDLGPMEANLAFRAARAFLAETETPEGVRMELTKGIPAGAGLGGGSSDAAAVLRAMNALWGGPLASARLGEIGASLGSDVPFFLGTSALARGRGRGEILGSVPPLPVADVVLVLPPVHVATAWAYTALGRQTGAGGTDAPGAPFAAPVRWEQVAALARNDFQEVVASAHPEVRGSLDALRASGARPAMLSGSGAACFGVFAGEAAAVAAAAALTEALGWPARAVRTLPHLAQPEPWLPRGVEGPPRLG